MVSVMTTGKLTALVVDSASSAVPVTVGIFKTGSLSSSTLVYLVDPSRDEERLLHGSLSVVVDTRDGSFRFMKQEVIDVLLSKLFTLLIRTYVSFFRAYCRRRRCWRFLSWPRRLLSPTARC